MRPVYVDTSAVVAVAFDEPSAARCRRFLTKSSQLFSANLLEAELRSVVGRERVALSDLRHLLDQIRWILPDRPLSAELEVVARAGWLRGADLWHVACALYLRRWLPALEFLTLDRQQGELTRALGFKGPDSGSV